MTKVWRTLRFFLLSPGGGVTLDMKPEPGGLASRESFSFPALVFLASISEQNTED
jgi:hypothetical protein